MDESVWRYYQNLDHESIIESLHPKWTAFEPINEPVEKENDLNQASIFLGSMWIFEGVFVMWDPKIGISQQEKQLVLSCFVWMGWFFWNTETDRVWGAKPQLSNHPQIVSPVSVFGALNLRLAHLGGFGVVVIGDSSHCHGLWGWATFG